MKTKEQWITELKADFPTIRVGSDENGYNQLSADEYETKISEWADNLILQAAQEEEAKQTEIKRQALLDRLGITEEEARLLLG